VQRRTFLASAMAALATQGHAMPRPYRLGPDGATISYTFRLNGTAFTGTVPIDRADLTIDARNFAASTADVTADVRRARTGMLLATKALKSRRVLAAADYPLARFQSTRVTPGPGGRMSDGATLEGLLTLRGVTRPITFDAQMFGDSDAARGDLRMMNVILTGSVDRRDYGATGYGQLVADNVDINITAQIETTT